MEECTGGELFDRILDRIESKHPYSEKEACQIFKQMMSAVSYCHKEKICHRDLKPENLLFLTKDETSPIKVIDFGLSKIVAVGENVKGEKTKSMKTKVGTVYIFFYNFHYKTFQSIIIRLTTFLLKSLKEPTTSVAIYGPAELFSISS